MNQTPVYMSDIEAQRFVDFVKHYDLIKKLADIGAFQMRLGTITLSYDMDGNILTVEKKQVVRY